MDGVAGHAAPRRDNELKLGGWNFGGLRISIRLYHRRFNEQDRPHHTSTRISSRDFHYLASSIHLSGASITYQKGQQRKRSLELSSFFSHPVFSNTLCDPPVSYSVTQYELTDR